MKSDLKNCRHSFIPASGHLCDRLRNAVITLKERLIARYDLVSPGDRLAIRNALTEAENQAWETPFPHLFFPDFADIHLEAVFAGRELAYARAA